MSGRVGASSRLSKRLLLSIVAVSGLFAVAAFFGSTVGAQQSEQMVASWYGPGFEGATTASGVPFDPYGYTAAHKTLPFGTKLIVTYQGTSVVVEINDRGPFIAGRDLDLSQGAAEYIGLAAAGEGVVDVVYADASTPVGPYSGTAAPAQQRPTQQQAAAPQSKPRVTSDTTVTVQDQYADEGDSVSQDQYANEDGPSQDQYANEPAAASAADEQYADIASEVASTPVVPPAATLEIPPAELVIPDSTVERRIELETAAPPVDYVAPEVEPEVVEEPQTVDAVYEAPKVVTGVTVLPDTGGLPLLPIAAAAAASLLFGGGLAIRALRR